MAKGRKASIVHGLRRYVPGYGSLRAETDCGLSVPIGRSVSQFGAYVTCKRCLAAQQRQAEKALADLEREEYGGRRIK